MLYIAMYLGAAVAANLTVAYFGKAASPFIGFFFIAFDLTARDKLHDAWQHKNLWFKMLALIAAGSVISYLLNRNAGMIAVGSFAAFAVAGVIDAIIYHFLRDQPWLIKVNGSNVFSALADSIVFPTIAFGSFMPLIVLAQFGSKFSGGLFWSFVISKVSKKEIAEPSFQLAYTDRTPSRGK